MKSEPITPTQPSPLEREGIEGFFRVRGRTQTGSLPPCGGGLGWGVYLGDELS